MQPSFFEIFFSLHDCYQYNPKNLKIKSFFKIFSLFRTCDFSNRVVLFNFSEEWSGLFCDFFFFYPTPLLFLLSGFFFFFLFLFSFFFFMYVYMYIYKYIYNIYEDFFVFWSFFTCSDLVILICYILFHFVTFCYVLFHFVIVCYVLLTKCIKIDFVMFCSVLLIKIDYSDGIF